MYIYNYYAAESGVNEIAPLRYTPLWNLENVRENYCSNIYEDYKVMLDELKQRIDALGIKAEFDESVVKMLAHEGFDPVYGARPLRRAITRKVEDSFSNAMLSQTVKAGDNVVAKLGENDSIIWVKA